MAIQPDPSGRVAVLVEGRSDAAVVRRLALAWGVDQGLDVIDMGGVTNVRRWLAILRREAPQRSILGLCDAAERHIVLAALGGPLHHHTGLAAEPATDPERLASHGFFVCDADLEDELIRAVGAEGVERALADLGDLQRFRRFQRQPSWRDRPLQDQLHRFAGSGSGRKLALADHLAAGLRADAVPVPLDRLMNRIAAVGL